LVLAISVASASGRSTNQVASAQTASTGSPTLELTGESPWTPIGGAFTMRLQGRDLPGGTSVALTVHDALRSRTGFDQSVDGGALPATRDRTVVPFDTLPVDPSTGDRLLVLPNPQLTEGGVYPLEVDLRSAADLSLSRFVTHVVIADLTGGHLSVGVPLNVAWVWPLRTEPAYLRVGASPNPTLLADLAPSGRLGRQATQLAANLDVPLTIAPSPETLAAWDELSARISALSAGAAAVRSVSPRDEVLTGPFVPLDLPSVLAAGLEGVVSNELGRGVNALEQFFGTHLDPSTALPGPLDQVSLRLLQSASIRQLVVRSDALAPVAEKYTPAHPYKMQAVSGDDSTAVSAVATDPGFERFLSGTDPPALRAAHLLAGLALVAGEQPSVTRGVALVNPDRWDANDTFVRATLAGLRQNPLLNPTTVAGLLAAVPLATPANSGSGTPAVVRQLGPYQPPAAPVTLRAYEQAQNDQVQITDLVGAADPRVERGDRALASAVATAWANAKGRQKARALLADLRTSLIAARTQITSQVQVQPRTTITITSSKAQIPIGFKNVSAHAVTVHLKLDSDRLLFPDGAERNVTLPPSRSTTVRVAVETRSSGQSPLFVTVTTAGGLPVTPAPVRITVRSSFVSGVGVFLTVGAMVFLALWWGWDFRRRRRGRTPARKRQPALAT
jgi:hypothetical protein